MTISTKECPRCGENNSLHLKKCEQCDAVLHYGKDYYKFIFRLSIILFIGALLLIIIELLQAFGLVAENFWELLPNWAFYLLFGFFSLCFLIYFIIGLADFDEYFNE